jgi:hypothetical protein
MKTVLSFLLVLLLPIAKKREKKVSLLKNESGF